MADTETTRQKGWTRLPAALSDVAHAIEKSRELLQLPQDWDDEGAVRISEDTWERAADFLARQALCVWERGRLFPVPDITPTPDGGIDLHWDKPLYELLIHLSADPKVAADFYGDDRGAGLATIRGQLDPGRCNEGLVLWLMKE